MDLHVVDENGFCFAETRYIFIRITANLQTFTDN